MNFLIDPYVIALPLQAADGKEVEEYLFQLQNWSVKIADQKHKFWMSRQAHQVLWDKEIYPTYSKIITLYQWHPDIEIFDPNLVSRACEHLLQCPPYIEDEIETQIPDIKEVLIDESKTIILPEKLSQRLEPPAIADALKETLSFLTCAKEVFSLNLVEDLLFATRSWDNEDEYVYVKIWFYKTIEEESDLESTWIIVENPSQLEEVSKLEDFWENTDQAILWAYQDLVHRKILVPDTHTLPKREKWHVNKAFNESIIKNHFNNRYLLARIFYTVVKVLVGYWPIETNSRQNHAIVGKGGQLKRARDNSKAWRAYVTITKPRIRLHYWRESENNIVELSVIVLHDDMTIE